MKRALEYIEKLADGTDPITDEPITAGGVYDNVRLCRCFYYVADVLKRVIANGGEVGKRQKAGYIFDKTEMQQVAVSEKPLALTRFIEHIHNQIGVEKAKIPRKIVADWLMEKGYLIERQIGGGAKKIASAQGNAIGMSNEEVQGPHGSYIAVYYNADAQELILNRLEEIFGGSEA